ncbi:MAG: carboxypeptidase-like regulatory domain-containing protein [Pirellula sp.]
MRSTRIVFLCLIASLVASVVGCGSGGPQLGRVKGKVTVDGKPVPRASITFFPDFQGSTSYGVTDNNGNYELMFTDTDHGAMVGKFHVGIASKKMARDEMPDGMKPEEFTKMNAEFVEIPKKYRGERAFEVEVKAGSNTINLEMDSK